MIPTIPRCRGDNYMTKAYHTVLLFLLVVTFYQCMTSLSAKYWTQSLSVHSPLQRLQLWQNQTILLTVFCWWRHSTDVWPPYRRNIELTRSYPCPFPAAEVTTMTRPNHTTYSAGGDILSMWYLPRNIELLSPLSVHSPAAEVTTMTKLNHTTYSAGGDILPTCDLPIGVQTNSVLSLSFFLELPPQFSSIFCSSQLF